MNNGSIRALDGAGDWAFGQGLSNYLTGQAAIIQDVETALLFFQNDCFWATTFGVDWWNLLGQTGGAAENAILLQCRKVILGVHGVVSIASVNASLNSSSRTLTISYSINTVYSQASGSVQPSF